MKRVKASPVVVRRDSKGGTRFHVLVGIAGGLALLALIATLLLFMRAARPVEANAVGPLPPAPVPVEVKATEHPSAPAAAVAEAVRTIPEPVKAVRRKAEPAPPVRASVWPPENVVHPPAGAEPTDAGTTSTSVSESTATEPEHTAESATSTPAVASPGEAEPEVRKPGKMRKVFGSILRPFRGKKPPEQ